MTIPQITTFSAAPPGWRLAYLKTRAPWVRFEAIAGWTVANGWVEPMIRDKGRGYLRTPGPNDDFEIAAPGETDEEWVERAKEAVARSRRAKRAARKGAKTRAKNRTKAERKVGTHKLKKPKRRRMRRSPKVARLRTGRFWRTSDPLKSEGLDLLYDFLGESCRLGKRHNADADALFAAYQTWTAAFDAESVGRADVTRALKELECTGTKRGGRIAHWRGIELLPLEPPIPVTVEGDPMPAAWLPHFFATGTRGDHFWKDIDADVAHYVYRAWCRRHVLLAVERRAFDKALMKQPGITRRTREGGTVRWEGIHFRWPE